MVQIQQPEVEALIQQRLTAGGLENIEAVLLQALTDAPLPCKATSPDPAGPSGPDVIAAFQRSPHKEINIFPESFVPPVSDPIDF